ncbi:MAG: cell division protein ZapA [Pseudomonadota bacterium]
MTQVSVQIGGREYRMACNEDEEAHLLTLARDLDERISTLKQDFGEIGDTRAVIMAALMIADELWQVRTIRDGLERDLATLSASRSEDVARATAGEGELADLIDRAAQRIESLAVALGSHRVPAAPVSADTDTERGNGHAVDGTAS